MHNLKQEEQVGSTTNTLRELIRTGALGINPDTAVTLSYEYSEEVAHYNDDYQDGVFSSSGIAYMLSEFLTTGEHSSAKEVAMVSYLFRHHVVC